MAPISDAVLRVACSAVILINADRMLQRTRHRANGFPACKDSAIPVVERSNCQTSLILDAFSSVICVQRR